MGGGSFWKLNNPHVHKKGPDIEIWHKAEGEFSELPVGP